MLATRRISRPGSWRSATRQARPYTSVSSRGYGSTIEPAYRIMEVGTCTRMETRTAGGISATVIVDKTTDERDYTYGWFKESPLNLSGVPMTFFCTIPENDAYDSGEPEVQLHFREITRAVRRRSHRNDLHRYFELVLRVSRQVFHPFTRVWVNRWQIIGHSRPIPVPPPLRFELAVQQMEIINGRRCLIVFFYSTHSTVRSPVTNQIENPTNQQAPHTAQQPHVERFEDQWQGNFHPREPNTSSTLDDDMERIIAGIRDIL
ncbi:hypothetical protein L873DRAFT_1802018 [Choiromyces venosus 120613-1]|uniref:Uncharacterized protein n=1 Tax=Choiromyces venosus 120613-1 TaxID=1336337 RepID=A0A3N4JW32_9PEZI|nr:hypothetical protein L873DRAFT_1802018 [Choiromyces venosus 120613-1]